MTPCSSPAVPSLPTSWPWSKLWESLAYNYEVIIYKGQRSTSLQYIVFQRHFSWPLFDTTAQEQKGGCGHISQLVRYWISDTNLGRPPWSCADCSDRLCWTCVWNIHILVFLASLCSVRISFINQTWTHERNLTFCFSPWTYTLTVIHHWELMGLTYMTCISSSAASRC